jgi:hypothetical protein
LVFFEKQRCLSAILFAKNLKHLGAALDASPGHGPSFAAALGLHRHFFGAGHVPFGLALNAVSSVCHIDA